jgi:outer membrane protein TolC
MRTSSMVATLLVAGCAVGPNFERPAAPSVTEYMPGTPAPQTVSTSDYFGAAQHFIKGRDIPGQWWALYHSQPLNDLIE